MNKLDLIDLVQRDVDSQEEFYLAHGPNKHEQEEYFEMGVSVVAMNVGLLKDWLDAKGVLGDYESLSLAEQREVWEASNFHFGIFPYEDRDADFFWAK